MPKVVITHNVADVASWLTKHDERAEAIGSLGGTNVVDHAAADGSTSVAVSADVSDPPAFLAALASPTPEIGALMQDHGVQPPLVAYVEG